MKYIISEQQLATVFGMYNPREFLYYKNLAEPFRFKRQFMKKYPKNSVEWDYFSFLVNEYTSMSNG